MLGEEISQQNQSFSQYKERLSNFSNEFELGLFLFIARKSIWLILVIFTMALSGAYLLIRYSAPVYESTSVLQVVNDDNRKKALEFNNITEEEPMDVYLELIRSRFLFEKVINRLPLKVSYYKEGKILEEESYIFSPYIFSDVQFTDSSIIDEKIKILFNPNNTYTLNYSIAGKSFSFQGKANAKIITAHFSAFVDVVDLKFILQSQNDNKLYFTFNSKAALVSKYYPKLNVKIVNATAQTIGITVSDNNPHIAADLANMVAFSFKDFDSTRKTEGSNRILAFIDSQLVKVERDLRISQMHLQEFKRDNKVNDFKSVSDSYLKRITDLENDYLKSEINERILIEIEQKINKNASEPDLNNLTSALVGTEFENSLSSQVDELRELIKEKNELKISVTDRNKYMDNINYRIDLQVKIILRAITAVRSQISQRKNIINSKKSEIEEVFYGLPEKELEYANIEKPFAINEKYYTMLLEKKTEYSISGQGVMSQTEVLQLAVPAPWPVSPRKKLILFAFVLVAFMVSLIMILIKYVLHSEITSLNEITKISNASISILGMVPKYKKDIPVSQLIIDKNPKSLISESFRTLRTNLQFISNEAGPKIIAVTSTISGEGKTFVAINIGGIIAYSGKKVIILDLDMRKPKIHKGFNVENNIGMSTLLINRNTLSECVRNSSLKNLDFITAGPVPPNPAELIINGRLDEIIDELKTNYDFVIVDNPPVGLVSDGIHVLLKADYPLYIFRANYSKKNFVQNADRIINENGVTKLAAVLNGVDIDKGSYGYNYGYSYGYGYGYTYGENYFDSEERSKPGIISRLRKSKRKK